MRPFFSYGWFFSIRLATVKAKHRCKQRRLGAAMGATSAPPPALAQVSSTASLPSAFLSSLFQFIITIHKRQAKLKTQATQWSTSGPGKGGGTHELKVGLKIKCSDGKTVEGRFQALDRVEKTVPAQHRVMCEGAARQSSALQNHRGYSTKMVVVV